jgi:hypothetical protein
MTPKLYLSILCLIFVTLLSAGCTQQGTPAPAAPTPASTTIPATISLAPVTTAPPITPVPVATVTKAPAIVTTPPGTAPPVGGYRVYQDADYSLEYPGTWQTNATTAIMPEFLHTHHGCMVTTYYQVYQRIRYFSSSDGTSLIYASVVDTDTDVWPRDQNGQIDYADVVNAILGDPTHCAGTPAGAFTVTGVAREAVTGVGTDVIRYDFGKINSIGYADGAGSAFLVTGTHKHGIFVFYAANSTAGTWNSAGTHMFNTLKLNTNF